MLSWELKRLPLAAAGAVVISTLLVPITSASAHVKWFCGFDVAGQPRGLENVLCQDFEILVAVAVLALVTGRLIEATDLGEAMLRAINRVTGILRDNTEQMFRAGCGFFFIALWVTGGILLTPELTTESPYIPWLELAIAAGMLSRTTMPASAAGIVILYALAAWQYGVFHLADYPVFLGVAAYLALIGLQKDLFGVRPLDIARWTAAMTLMWASVEKWAYPEWSFPLFIEHPKMTFGYEPEFYMRAAGAVEFALAFSLLWTPLVRRVGAIMLTGMFISAAFEFGKLDVIGHTLIVIVLLAIIADDAGGKVAKIRDVFLVPVAYSVALAASLVIYYTAHAGLYGTSIT